MKKESGIFKKIDNLGRIVIPIDIRNSLNIEQGDELEFYVSNGAIIMKPIKKQCRFCGSTKKKEIIEYNCQYICKKCYDNITKIKDAMENFENWKEKQSNDLENKFNEKVRRAMEERHTKKIVNMLKELKPKSIEIIGKLGIEIEDKVYTEDEFNELLDNIREYYKYEGIEEEYLVYIKDLEGTGVTDKEVKQIVEEMYKIEHKYGMDKFMNFE